MTTNLELSIEEILKRKPEEIKRIYEEDLKKLQTGSSEERRRVALRHALYFLQFGDATERAAINALQKEANEGKIDALALENIDTAPSFERVRREPDGKLLWKRGMTVEGFKVMGDHVVTTVYSIFDDDVRRKTANKAQIEVSRLTEYARAQAENIELVKALETFKPLLPVYTDRNFLVNLFVDGQNLHKVLKESDVAGKHEHLSVLARVDAALHHFAKGRKTKFEAVDHVDRLIAKGVARNYPLYAKHFKENPVFASLFADLQGAQSFVHGDALPSNVIITWRESPEGPTPVYHPIDFEEASLDFVEAPLAQRLVKSGIYNERGESAVFGESTLEEEVLMALQSQAKKLDPDFDIAVSTKRFLALKAEQYLIWASRYRAAAEVASNCSELLMLSRYYYTLFCREVAQQGRVKDINDLSELSSLFKPLDACQMRVVHESLQPQNRSISAFKVDSVGRAEDKLEQMMQDYNRRRHWRIGRRIAAGIALFGALAGGIFGYKEFRKTQEQLQSAELKGKYAEKVRIIRLSQSRGSAYSAHEIWGLDDLGMWEKKFKDDELARAAFIDYAILYRAMKDVPANAENYKREVVSKIRELSLEMYCAMLDTEYLIDSWMHSPQLNGLFTEEGTKQYEEAKAQGMPFESGRERLAYERVRKIMSDTEEAYEAEQRQKAQKPVRYSAILGDLDEVSRDLHGNNK